MEQADSRPSRRFERRPVKANAFIHFRGLFQLAKVIDYSDGGVQLDGTFGLIKTDRIQIEFISGTRVPGRVAWSLGAQTGVVFSPPLASSHPAMVELARKARRTCSSRNDGVGSSPI
jgi:PilZ domain